MSFTDIMSMYHGLEAKKRDDELKSKLRKALLAGAARMHLRSRGEEENDETAEVDEANRQLRRYQASICAVYEDLGYGPYITSGQAEADHTQNAE